jgi:hypothetical protein
MRQRLLFAQILTALLISLPAAAQVDGAKGLYFTQMDNPNKSLNTGVQYWIELHRGDDTLSVNNKYSFQSGDKIRFHVQSNIDGYAYIILKAGSRGEQSVLFPDQKHADDTHIARGHDYSLPNDGLLTFDENPGMENVVLLLSRAPIDPDAYLSDPKKEHTLIASKEGSKDLVPAKILLAYDPPKEAFHPQDRSVEVSQDKQPVKRAEPGKSKKAVAKQHHTTNHQTANASIGGGGISGHSARGNGTGHGTTLSTSIVTVVNRDPADVLALDVPLNHEK